MIANNTFNFELSSNEEMKLNYLLEQSDISNITLHYDFADDPADLSLNGTSFASKKNIYPVAGGFDVGCGYAIFFTNMKFTTELVRLLENNSFVDELDNLLSKGSHFFEIRVVGRIFDCLFSDEFSIETGDVVFFIHNGIKEEFKNIFIKLFFEAIDIFEIDVSYQELNGFKIKIPLKTELSDVYLENVTTALKYAKKCRKDVYIKAKGYFKFETKLYFDVPHEFVEYDGNLVNHYKGVQKYIDIKKYKIAYVSTGAKNSNYIVKKREGCDVINHGVRNDEIQLDDSLFFRRLISKELLYDCVMELKPFVGIKNGEMFIHGDKNSK